MTNDNISLALNGEPVPLKNLRITVSMKLPDKDQSGQSSSTSSSEQGTKAKELRVAGSVPFTDPDSLRRIFEMAAATDQGGAKQKYRVANATARAVRFREAIFTGSVDAPQQDGLQAWAVTFTLREQISVAEKKEQRANGKSTAKKQQPGSGSTAGGTVDAQENQEQMSWFESKVLSPINSALGGSSATDNASSAGK